ncbi:hypothetical protein ACFQFC_02100 [Amorphoplanes digitatis]|uniref:Cell division protein FtsW (Lipid II flippase) n=1 Tax=Actinoplanes digitatis TaxID=1868 RepID=A0A7W7HY69_9ACTN|nr:hypothetical protein [Actinoplanes digitatis]MBB4762969.1 cell division protein FtsW (lipid II flippase) [Actinoplanes digitatis]GID95829.1 hypothetical protein Adi01nite_52410 [Actinoplanes digitatis]
MRTRSDKDSTTAAAFDLARGCVVVVAAALVAAAVFAPADLGARLMVMAGTAGVLARLLADWRACVAVTVFATLVFVGFMAHQYGELAGDPSPWSHTIAIGFAALIGRGQRWIHAVNAHEAGTPMAGPPCR